ncbi:uncharacterized protein P174DRAFT_424342 [Aspergillus novofumigatus IBT 16806]|uniref:Uncharacterized protein n=1 Tax=Aspergillus novofumigatus (strain IBT 16806) TaxID=1392255 RepID=A0A2I1BXT7_ASPN1|nr:uncharacterized protein P174DRAFT_424342 [Aspergillus novofumigatus IBT 16806]PKX90151.1 hypothetical protein P174DRAFT_424342 [Aspergillus novofumigatus IBT 16806]
MLGVKCETLVERGIQCVLAKPSEGQAATKVVFGVDPGTGIDARYVEHIARQPPETPRLELSIRIGRLGCSRLTFTKGGSQSRRFPPVEAVKDEQDNHEEAEELIKMPLVVLLERSPLSSFRPQLFPVLCPSIQSQSGHSSSTRGPITLYCQHWTKCMHCLRTSTRNFDPHGGAPARVTTRLVSLYVHFLVLGMLENAHDLSAVLRWYAAFFETDDNDAPLWDPVLFSDIHVAVIILCEAFEHAELVSAVMGPGPGQTSLPSHSSKAEVERIFGLARGINVDSVFHNLLNWTLSLATFHAPPIQQLREKSAR